MELTQYIMDSRLILIPVLYVIGMIIKNTNIIKSKYIPVIILFLGILLSLLMGQNTIINNIIQGVLIAGTTVMTNQFIVQSRKSD